MVKSLPIFRLIVLLAAFFGSSRSIAQAPDLRIVVIEGEDAINVIQQKSAVAPVVEVRDRNDQPVAGAMFASRSVGAARRSTERVR